MNKIILSLFLLFLIPIGYSWTFIDDSSCGNACFDIEHSYTTDDTYAIGYSKIRKWNGTHFGYLMNNPFIRSGALYFFNDNFGIVAGWVDTTDLRVWDGISWTNYTGGLFYTKDIDCVDENFCMGSGQDGIAIWNGTDILNTGYSNTMWEVSCGRTRNDNCWISTVRNIATVYFFNWTYDINGNPLFYTTSPLPNYIPDTGGYWTVSDIHAISDNNVWLITGDSDASLCQIYYYNGNSWSNVHNLTHTGLLSPHIYMYDNSTGWFACGNDIYQYEDSAYSLNKTFTDIHSLGVNLPDDKVFIGTMSPDGIWQLTYHYSPPPPPPCEFHGFCSDNAICMLSSVLVYVIDFFHCVSEGFLWIVFGLVIGGIIVLMSKKALT